MSNSLPSPHQRDLSIKVVPIAKSGARTANSPSLRQQASPGNLSQRTRLSVGSPRKPPSAGGSNAKSFEAILHKNLVTMTEILLKANAYRTGHDISMVIPHVQQQALSMIEDDIEQKSETIHDKVTIYAHLSHQILRDIERLAIFSEHRQQVQQLRENNQYLRNEQSVLQNKCLQQVVLKEQAITCLESEKNVLLVQNQSLVKTVELLKEELGKAIRNTNEIQQKNVELCLQGLDFTGEVHQACDKVLECIQSRVGFIPKIVTQEIHHLKALKPPGDASYHKTKQQPNASHQKRKTARQGAASSSLEISSSSSSSTLVRHQQQQQQSSEQSLLLAKSLDQNHSSDISLLKSPTIASHHHRYSNSTISASAKSLTTSSTAFCGKQESVVGATSGIALTPVVYLDHSRDHQKVKVEATTNDRYQQLTALQEAVKQQQRAATAAVAAAENDANRKEESGEDPETEREEE